jgi:hypothetical protein
MDAIGWVKARELARFVTSDNHEELVDLAKKKNVKDFVETLKVSYTTDGMTPSGRKASREGMVKKTTLKFSFFEDTAEFVNYTLEEAKKQFGTEDLNMVLEGIIQQWAQHYLHPNKAKKAQKLQSKAGKGVQQEVLISA